MNQTSRSINLSTLLLGVVIASGLVLIVLAALVADALPALVLGVVVLGLISIGLAAVYVKLFARFTDAVLKRKALDYDHIEHVLRLGYLPAGNRYEPLTLPAPEEDVPVSTQGVTGTMLAEYREDALAVVALSKQIMPRQDKGDQIIPYHKAKVAHEYFKSGMGFERWQHGIQYLLTNQKVTERTQQGAKGIRHLGYYCIAGTIGQLYEFMERH